MSFSGLDLDRLFADLDAAGETNGGASASAADQFSSDDISALFDFGGAPTTAQTPVPAKRAAKAGARDRQRKSRQKKREKAGERRIAVLDFETDPFDNVARSDIFPFLAVLYSDHFETVVIWENDFEAFVDAVIDRIAALPGKFTIYAHNGGKFDFMFLMSRIKGDVMFKGRGLMKAFIGAHELRDSYHIIPDRLANFKKDHIDYENMTRARREIYRNEIIKYCIADCRYLYDLVTGFDARFGNKISIGQAAMMEIRKHYKFDNLREDQDAYLRQWFYGGRVECLQGAGRFTGDYKLYDVNSMYPFVMAHRQHPIGNTYVQHRGAPTADTIFLEVRCKSRGAFCIRDDTGTHFPHGHGTFKTTIWEYNIALKHNLISDVTILKCIDFPKRTDFSLFVVPNYDARQVYKRKLSDMAKRGEMETREYIETKKDDMFVKFLLNNGYGKFAQNPRKYKQHYITDPGVHPTEAPDYDGDADDISWGDMPKQMCGTYWIWERPNPGERFNNVATGASITGAARAELLDAIHSSNGAIYCDTDSLVCKSVSGLEIDKVKLGAWDLEDEFSEVIVAGKKLYACLKPDGSVAKIRCKGASGLSYQDFEKLIAGASVTTVAKGTTISRTGKQHYMERAIRATAKPPLKG